ncbi:hypothetical protein JB92DRAFT_2931127, partial [Gautieria morchelliformis]
MSIAPQSFITITEYSALASLVLFLYDHAITFDAEVSHEIWSGPRTWGKLLFLWVNSLFRLSSLIIEVQVLMFHGSLSNKCFFWWEAVSYHIIANVSVDSEHWDVIVSQVYAVIIAKNNSYYGLALRLITTAVSIVVEVLTRGITSRSQLDWLLQSFGVEKFRGFFHSFLANELVLCFLMLYKQRDRYRNEFGSSQLSSSTLAVHLTNLLVFYLAPRSLALVAIGWEFAIPCTMGCRLLLNVLNHYGSGEHTILLQSRQNASYLLSDVHMQSLSSTDVKPL